MYLEGIYQPIAGINPAELVDEYELMCEAIDVIGYEPSKKEEEFMTQAEGYLLEFGYL